jgi:hypothetical protein
MPLAAKTLLSSVDKGRCHLHGGLIFAHQRGGHMDQAANGLRAGDSCEF